MNFLKYITIFICLTITQQLQAGPRIVVTINPIYALVAAVAEGVSTPELLIQANSSPHDFVLKPSDMRKLSKADIIFLIDLEFEHFLEKVIESNSKAQVVELAKNPQLLLLPARSENLWGLENNSKNTIQMDDNYHDHAGHHHGLMDYHIWTDPNNAKIIVEHINQVLTAKDPDNRKIYLANTKKILHQLMLLDEQMNKDLTPYKQSPYLVFHDAYQYFERHYKMKSMGAISINPNNTPSAKKITQIKQLIKDSHALCLFSEPSFSHKIVEYISSSTGIRTGVLDVEWGEGNQHYNGYISMMLNLKTNLVKCLTE